MTLNTPWFVNFVATSPAQPNLPCFSCVNGNSGYAQTVIISWTTLNFTGDCYVALAITSGKHLIHRASYNTQGITPYGAWEAWYTLSNINYSGEALMVTKIRCGSHGSVTQAPIVFQ